MTIEISYFKLISMTLNCFEKFIEKHLDKDWDWGEYGLSRNPSITPQLVEKHLDKPWHWGQCGLSENPSITPQFVEKHMHKNWYWGSSGLSSNPNITPQFIEKHIDKEWYWGEGGLSRNTFKKSIEDEAARTIQRGCHNWLWKPKCNDGTLGINVRLSLKELGIN